jgi:hypothetical protein
MALGVRKLVLAATAIALALATGESFARFYLGLGDPPLTVRDPEIEYRFAPSRTYARFGNRVTYNAYSMRSEEFPPHKTAADEVRILVFGDSVVNGGALTDQDDLATEILQRRLRQEHGIAATVGNVSAGSWGPANLLAYVRRFGWFEADLAFVLLSSHDLGDVPTFPVELGPDFPLASPAFALQEAVVRYLPRYLPAFPAIGNAVRPAAADSGDRPAGARHLAELLAEARAAVPHVVLLLHPTPRELREGLSPDGKEILRIAHALDVPALSVADAISGSTSVYYRDDIHITAQGQLLYARLMICESLAVLAARSCGG